ncbi:hydroxymethylglutaryl-CoA lyase [Tsukamurella soli]|uniref:Hydroxymethylglutaryl-CoA lyase n=1 Tax=Tsukamurella soli TaxID=644556 RepID=A0ABP8JKE5_9ACTN
MTDTARPHLEIREVGLRDGLQLEDPVPLAAKLALLDAIAVTGVREIEATSFVSPTAVPAFADAEELAAHLHRWPDITFSALVASPNGARRAVTSNVVNLEYVVSATDAHSAANVRRTTEEALTAVSVIADLAHGAGGTAEVIIAVAWDCPFSGRVDADHTAEIARRAVEAGADRISFGDTIGTVVPGRMTQLLDVVGAVAPGVELGVHLHNTRGIGLASAWAAYQAGVTRFDASFGGLGGCPFAPGATGNIATEELAYMFDESGVDTGVGIDAVLDAVAVLRDVVGHDLSSNLFRAHVAGAERVAARGRAQR